jgi:adenylosuccinate lyase
MVQRHALKAGREGGDLKRDLLKDDEIRRYLSAKDVEAVWGVKHHLANVDVIFRRVFG